MLSGVQASSGFSPFMRLWYFPLAPAPLPYPHLLLGNGFFGTNWHSFNAKIIKIALELLTTQEHCSHRGIKGSRRNIYSLLEKYV